MPFFSPALSFLPSAYCLCPLAISEKLFAKNHNKKITPNATQKTTLITKNE